jgi:hypothetical protein
MRAVTVAVRDGLPVSFLYKQQQVRIREIADAWRETGRWWDGEAMCEFFLVVAESGSFLLCRDLTAEEWYVKAVQ